MAEADLPPGLPLRDATVDDAALLSRINVQSWRETYAGLLSDRLLAGLEASPFHGPRHWRDALARKRADQWTWVVGVDAPVGLCRFGADDEIPRGGLIDRLYLLRAAQRRGLGRRLMIAAAGLLAARGLAPLSVWTLECNAPARTFYERLGGRRLPRRVVFEDQGAPVFEVGFRWDRPESLSEITALRSSRPHPPSPRRCRG